LALVGLVTLFWLGADSLISLYSGLERVSLVSRPSAIVDCDLKGHWRSTSYVGPHAQADPSHSNYRVILCHSDSCCRAIRRLLETHRNVGILCIFELNSSSAAGSKGCRLQHG